MDTTWFVEHFPVALIQGHSDVDTRHNAPWFDKFQSDIEKNGLASPLLVNNRQDRNPAFYIAAGNNRLQAVRRLGWTTVPIVVFGKHPGVEAVELPTYEDVQAMMGDGIVGIKMDGGLKLNNALLPNQGKFPKGRYYGRTQMEGNQAGTAGRL